MRILPALGLLLLASGCAPRSTVISEEGREEMIAAPAITLERTACFGTCPVYRLAVTADGTVSYEGRANVRQLGRATAQVPPRAVEALLGELEGAGYFSFANRYTGAERACGRYVTDLPSAIISVNYRGRSKRIVHDQGCGSAPGALTVLARRIDEVLRSGRWTGR
jgi:Domain of unknown function (DUF6438)